MSSLDFDTLREANAARLPLFENKHGQFVHIKPDGSDWSPAQWLQALVGELGEWATERTAYESGEIDMATFEERSAKELADVQTYLDILARRSLDTLTTYPDPNVAAPKLRQGYPFEDSPAQALMEMISVLGIYANARKKLDRGDISEREFLPLKRQMSARAKYLAQSLDEPDMTAHPHPGDVIEAAHPKGVDLGQATIDKFNEVSRRVNAAVSIEYDSDIERFTVR